MRIFLIFLAAFLFLNGVSQGQNVKRARDYGVPFQGVPGTFNAITDVPGVTAGEVTIRRGNGPLVKGQGPVRTGVTVILPRGAVFDPVDANWYTLNGNGDITGMRIPWSRRLMTGYSTISMGSM
jgi:D-aminopeptidase